ncbi:tetratricopeptide repeat protein [Candidatus Riflebacteria bacterium]
MMAKLTDIDLKLKDVVTLRDEHKLLKELTKYSEEKPDSVIPLFIISKINFLNGRLIDAGKGYKACLEVEDSLPYIFFEAGICEFYKANFHIAIKLFKKVLEKNKEDILAHYWLGLSYLNEMEFAPGPKYSTTAVHLPRTLPGQSPESTYARMKLGRVNYMLGNFDEAIQNYEDVVAGHSDNVLAFYYLGELYEKKGKIIEAIEIYKKGLEQNPDQKNIKKALEYLQSGDNP